jgi:hypothetical protein
MTEPIGIDYIASINEELADLIKPGNAVKIFYNPGNINNRLIHIRAIVDDDEIVYRFWSKYRQCWIYEMKNLYFFILLHRDGFLKRR